MGSWCAGPAAGERSIRTGAPAPPWLDDPISRTAANTTTNAATTQIATVVWEPSDGMT